MIERTGILHRLLFPSLVWRINSPALFLTFDDGPDPVATQIVLRALREKDVQATFFLTGENAERYPEIVREIALAGHTIGNHGYVHSRSMTFSYRRCIEEIRECKKVLDSLHIPDAKLFRPPYGYFSWNTINACRTLGYSQVMWSYLTGDFRQRSIEKIVLGIDRFCSAGDILVYHDNLLTRNKIGPLLEQTIDRLHKKGFSFLPLHGSL